MATTRIDAAGVSREIRVPVAVEWDGGELVARGSFVVTHGQIGLVPFSAALGALRVREEIEVDYRLVARPEAS